MSLHTNVHTIEWVNPSTARLIDQTILPEKLETVDITNYKDMEGAIKDMLIRGAPAIGIAGAFGLVLGALELSEKVNDSETFFNELQKVAKVLEDARPTAVNLAWAINRLMKYAEKLKSLEVKEITAKLKEEAIKMHKEDLDACKTIGDHGAKLVPEGATIMTHCNAGGLATVGYGTALGVIRSAYAKDKSIRVFANETRPRQQGARLTAWELLQDNINTTLVTDGMCAHLMSKGLIDMVVVGADRIASNGDTANKIGTLTVALAAKEYGVPFYVAAPVSTIDPYISDGSLIPIEERNKEEVTIINGKHICPDGVNVVNPAFDVTPAKYIAGIITERGVLRADYKKSIAELFASVTA
jgi:methylthioribose-1-phosphate isomerase